ncbi:hypothetical protein MKW92_026112 [Papaver armeniacum]|nr:hypothetical protein MKW92_026112 [Papaver armeniacum]
MYRIFCLSKVCANLSSTVRSDARLWRDIHIDRLALRERITDDAFLQLDNRAQGNLRTLSLIKCSKITDDGLKRVLERNPRLIKLNVPGCTRLTVEGILKCLKNFKSRNTPPGGIKQIYFEELKSLIGEDSCRHKSYLFPRCCFFRMVYDCPAKSCHGKKVKPHSCRACKFCISRCYQCGWCINDTEFEETFFLEPFFSDYWNQVKA